MTMALRGLVGGSLSMFFRIPDRLLPKRSPGPYGNRRTCKVKHCGTVLHRNNSGPLCMRHWIEQIPPEERLKRNH
jgi:hypothetical protein